MDHSGYYGISGLIVLVLDIWALVNILGSGQSVLTKVMWFIIVLLLPVLGFIFWLLAGPRSSR